jgi:hypothetical protein
MKTSGNKYVTLDANGWLALGDEGVCFQDDSPSDGGVHIKIQTYGGRYLGVAKCYSNEQWKRVGSYRKITTAARDRFKWEETDTDGKLRLTDAHAGGQIYLLGDVFFVHKAGWVMNKPQALIEKIPCPGTETKEVPAEKIKSWGFNPLGETLAAQIQASE